jgi:hypothetical protein
MRLQLEMQVRALLLTSLQSAMNRILQLFIPKKTRPFLDDIPINECALAERDETLTKGGVRKFIWDHIQDVEAILQRLIDAGLTLSGENQHSDFKK